MSGAEVSEKSGWPVVAAGFVCLAVAAGIGFFVFPVYLDIFQEEFGWSLTDVSGAITLWGIIGAILSPVFGKLIDAIGARKVMLFGTLCQFIATLLLARISALWHLYALMALASIGNVCNTYIPVAAVISKWFDKHRGTAIGVAMFGLGIGGGIMSKLADYLLGGFGWRTGYSILSCFVLALIIPILLWIRDPDSGYLAEKQETKGKSDVGHPIEKGSKDLTLSQSLRTRSFWGISVGDAIAGLVFAIFTLHLVTYMKDDGYEQGMATNIFSTFMFCTSVGMALFGLMADKVSLRGLMVFVYAMPAITTLLLFPTGIVTLPFLFAMLCGTCGGGRSALFPVALTRCFGETHMGAIYGLSNSFFLVGSALGPIIAATIYERYASARPVYALICGLLVVAALLISLMRRETIA